jgi:hypothetical protein
MKRIIMLAVPTALLVSALLLGGPAISSAQAHPSTFTDVAETNPAHVAIEALAARQIVSGDSSGDFLPNTFVTRGEAAKALVKWRGSVTASVISPFSDVDTTYQPYVDAALSNGWISGYPDRTFRPDQPLTREQMIAVVIRALGLESQAKALTEAEIADSLAPFADDTTISDGARAYVALAVRNKLVGGDQQARLLPLAAVTRAQLSMVIYRAENPVQDESVTAPSASAEDQSSASNTTLTPQEQAKADFMTAHLFQPHNSPITGEMVLQNVDWYGIPALSQLVIMAAETSLGDPKLGGALARHYNFGCMRYGGTGSAWGLLSDGPVSVAGKQWYSFPDAPTGMAAFGRYLKAGVNGFYLPILSQTHPDWERFAGVYYGRGVSGFGAYVSRLHTIESSFRSKAADHGVSL